MAQPSFRGVVSEFDSGRGLGTLIAADGRAYLFHCIEIADGSREITCGAKVMFDLLPKLGRYEAANLVKF